MWFQESDLVANGHLASVESNNCNFFNYAKRHNKINHTHTLKVVFILLQVNEVLYFLRAIADGQKETRKHSISPTLLSSEVLWPEVNAPVSLYFVTVH